MAGLDMGSTPPAPPTWDYTLLPGSQLTDDCYCGRPTITVALQGTFQLRWLGEDPLFARYAVTNISFTASIPGGTTYKVTGHGTFEFGGEVALRQQMFLQAHIDDGITNKLCYLTNDSGAMERPFPMIKVDLDQTNGAIIQFYRLSLAAAPLREIWFSTAHSLTAGIWQAPTNHVTGGDLISSAGQVVKRNQALTARFGIMPPVPDLGLDAVDVLPGGEIAFSIQTDIFSGTAGTLHEGDVLSSQGRIVTNYAALSGAFGPQPPTADQGLDALHVLRSGEIYFSVARDFFSERLGRMIRRGDLLSSAGRIVKANEELIAPFQPADPKLDYGLDAIYVWPSGEVWFSVEDGFYGQHFEPYGTGDLLSDQGYVVYRNLDMVSPFQPLEDLADFGLDALFIVTDVDAAPPASGALRCGFGSLDRKSGSVTVNWTPNCRLFQAEKAGCVDGPWAPISPIVTEPPVIDAGALTNGVQGFYRMRAW